MYRRLGGPQGRSGQVRKISPPPEFDPRTVQPVGSRYTDCATRPPTRKFTPNNLVLSDKYIYKVYRVCSKCGKCSNVDIIFAIYSNCDLLCARDVTKSPQISQYAVNWTTPVGTHCTSCSNRNNTNLRSKLCHITSRNLDASCQYTTLLQ